MSAQLSYLVEQVLENLSDEDLIDRLLMTKSMKDLDKLKDIFEEKIVSRKMDLYRLGKCPLSYHVLNKFMRDDKYEYVIRFEGFVSMDVRKTIEGFRFVDLEDMSYGWIRMSNGIYVININADNYTTMHTVPKTLKHDEHYCIIGNLFITECIPK
jgi:hypothetical protein